jgi:hypothetical protein
MKSYCVARRFLWSVTAAKIVLTSAAGVAYVLAVTHPTPLGPRLLLLACMTAFGWLYYVRLPRMPTQIDLSNDGWVQFRGRKGTQKVHVGSIRSIGQGIGRRTVKVRHGGGRIRMPNRVEGFYDFLSTVKSLNPAIVVRGF